MWTLTPSPATFYDDEARIFYELPQRLIRDVHSTIQPAATEILSCRLKPAYAVPKNRGAPSRQGAKGLPELE
jgi:hypothetical protein